MKNSILLFVNAMVTLIVSSFNASSAGEGRKSSTRLTLPIGSSVYSIFLLIYLLALSPISCSEDSDLLVSIHEPNSQNTLGSSTYAVITVLISTM